MRQPGDPIRQVGYADNGAKHRGPSDAVPAHRVRQVRVATIVRWQAPAYGGERRTQARGSDGARRRRLCGSECRRLLAQRRQRSAPDRRHRTHGKYMVGKGNKRRHVDSDCNSGKLGHRCRCCRYVHIERDATREQVDEGSVRERASVRQRGSSVGTRCHKNNVRGGRASSSVKRLSQDQLHRAGLDRSNNRGDRGARQRLLRRF
mmetsp:Transcript_26594/g.92448  ORF Transcript_26594/g.92448 Transcript_26594/m.92448 type:complete len:205 (-) Transcript_26594:3476-4090(-)